MFNTNSAYKAIFCPKNFIIVLTALVCFLSSAVVSAQTEVGRMQSSFEGEIPGNSCTVGLTVPISDSDRSNCIQVDPANLDAINTANISRELDESASSNEIGIIDWVVVELRVFNQGQAATDSPDDAQTTYRQPALLRSDGIIINADAVNLLASAEDAVLTLGFEDFDDSTQDAYIIIEHRFHLGIMSANPVTPDEEYDFSASSSQIRGVAGFSFKETLSQVWPGLWVATGGNLNDDIIIRFGSDSPFITNNPGSSLGYYVLGDINLDSTTSAADFAILLRSLDNRSSYTK